MTFYFLVYFVLFVEQICLYREETNSYLPYCYIQFPQKICDTNGELLKVKVSLKMTVLITCRKQVFFEHTAANAALEWSGKSATAKLAGWVWSCL